MRKIIGTKSEKWSYEKEIRIITDNPGKQTHDHRAVKAIYFGLRMLDDQKENIMKRLSGRNIKYFQMRLKEKSYTFEANTIEDPYQYSPKYLYKIASIEQDAIDESSVKDYLKAYIPYLYKASEIARREPNCEIIEVVSFSLSKSRPNHPVIYVNYKSSSQNFAQLYYTITEIDQLYSQITDL